MLETWSKNPVSFNNTETVYMDFRENASEAFGNNLVQVSSAPIRYAFYSGDVNHDGLIDLTDILLIYNDAVSFITGNIASDLTGETVVDLNDILIAYNNSVNFVIAMKP